MKLIARRNSVLDISGKIFGRLTVIEYSNIKLDSSKTLKKRRLWKCLCECGSICYRRSESLGNRSSCGKHCKLLSLRIDDLSGKTYRDIKVVGYAFFKSGQAHWNCICHCGNEFTCGGQDLKRKTKSCGCKQYENREGHKFYSGYKEISGKYFSQVKVNAKRRNFKFDVSIEYLWKLFIKQDKKCALSGAEIWFPKHSKDKICASLDRIDSSKGYIKGNLQFVHKTINIMKSNLNEDEFINFCKLVSINNK